MRVDRHAIGTLRAERTPRARALGGPELLLTFDLLPASGLDLTVLITVLVGTIVLAYLTESFGWSFGGLVVPGYLAAVLLVSPEAGVTVLFEAVLTYAAVGLLSDGVARLGLWSPFFGRERFLLLVVVSILVRQSAEIWLWPALLAQQEAWLGTTLLQMGEAHSVGLVLVPLAANALGKGTRWGGIVQLLVPTALAWLILREVLFDTTNLSLSAMSLTYEDASLDFLLSARAYFVLAAGAFIAARLNGMFAWSAGGILVPALLGLAWYQPARIFATMGEAVVLAVTFRLLVRLPVVRHWNLEGTRKLAVLFTLSTLFRLSLAWVHEAGLPVRTDELSGLGYLLSALMALKILQFGSVPTALLPALGTSLLGFGIGSTAAWGLEHVVPGERGVDELGAEPVTSRLLGTPEGVVEYARVRVRLDPERSPSVNLPKARVASWSRFWEDVGTGDAIPEPPAWMTLTTGSGSFGGRPWQILHERTERLDRVEGWGLAILRPGGTGGVVLVERAWTAADAARGAVSACVARDCSVLFVAGMDLPTGTDDARRAFEATIGLPLVRAEAGTRAGIEEPAGDSLPGVGDVVLAALDRRPGRWLPSVTEQQLLTSVLAPALDAWTRGESSDADVGARAATVGLDATRTRCGDDTCLTLTPRVSGPIVAVRRGAAGPSLVTAAHPVFEVGALRTALGAFDSLRSTALFLDPTPDGAVVEPIRDPLHALHLGWRRALADRGGSPLALWIRGIGRGEPGEARPTEDVVIGAGRPIFGEPPATLQALVTNERLAGVWTYRWARGAEDEPGLAGNHLPGLQAYLAFGDVTPAVLWLSPNARAAWRSEDRVAIADWLSACGLGLTDGDGASAPAPAAAGPAVRPRSPGGGTPFDRLADLTRRAAHQHNANLVRLLVEASGPGTSVSAGWDTSRLLGWLEVRVETPAGARVQRAWLVPGDGREVHLPNATAPETIRAAIGWMPADLRLTPEGP